MTMVETASPESLLSAIYELTHDKVRRTAFKYANTYPGPMSDPDDYEQNVYMRLLEWLRDARHREQAEGLLENPSEAVKFMQSFTRARICDHLDVNLARPRDQRLTIHASECPLASRTRNDDVAVSILDLLSRQSPEFDGGEGMVLCEIRKRVPFLAGRLLAALVNPPKRVREAFWESRIRVSEGLAVLAEPVLKHDPYVLTLTVQEGYNLEEQTVSWHSATLENRTLDTTLGPAALSYPKRGQITLRFDANLTVWLDGHSLEGEFLRESIRPSPRAFDVRIMADHLRAPMLHVREAWVTLRDALSAYVGVDDPELPLNV